MNNDDSLQKITGANSNELSSADIHDRIMEAYYGDLGESFMKETQDRIHWICNNVLGNRVMDIGCSQGIVPILLAREGVKVTGVDISKRAIEEAKTYLAKEPETVKSKVRYIHEDFLSLETSESNIDTIIISEVLEHLVRPEQFVKKAKDIVESTKGRLIVTVPFGINDFVDHKKTYYLTDIYELLTTHFDSVEYIILGKWIGVIADINDKDKKVKKGTLELEDVKNLELAFYQLESQLRATLAKQSNSANNFKASLNAANVKYRELHLKIKERTNEFTIYQQKLVSSKSEIRSLEEKLDSSKSEIRSLQIKLDASKSELKSLKERLDVSASKRDGHYSALVKTRHKLSAVESRLKKITSAKAYKLALLFRTLKTPKGIIQFPYILLKRVVKKILHKFNFRPFKQLSQKNLATKVVNKIVSKSTHTPTKQEISLKGWPEYDLSSGKLKVMAIMDEFTTGCFKDDVILIQPRPDNWQALFDKYLPDFIFIESAWKGNMGVWQYRVAQYANKPGNEVEEMANYAKTKGVPVLFWNKEDPVHHEKFMCSAMLADVIFTTDENMKSSYIEKTGNKRVHALPFAASSFLHKPKSSEGRISKACFAGTWYGDRHVERGESIKWLLDGAMTQGLVIYDRNFESGNFPFPEKYKEVVKGSLPYEKLCEEYGNYRVFLNVNSVTDSPTMFSRRVFELLASGTPVVSTYAKGIEEIFGNELVWFVNNEEDTTQALDALFNDPKVWRQRSLAGIRAVFTSHTYAERVGFISDCLGLESNNNDKKIVLLACAKSKNDFNELEIMVKSQRYSDFKVMVIADASLSEISDGRISFVSSLNKVNFSDNTYVSMINLSNNYGKDYIQDLVNATKYAPGFDSWGVAVKPEDAFLENKNIYVYSSLIKSPNVSSLSFRGSANETILAENSYAIDSDQFIP